MRLSPACQTDHHPLARQKFGTRTSFGEKWFSFITPHSSPSPAQAGRPAWAPQHLLGPALPVLERGWAERDRVGVKRGFSFNKLVISYHLVIAGSSASDCTQPCGARAGCCWHMEAGAEKPHNPTPSQKQLQSPQSRPVSWEWQCWTLSLLGLLNSLTDSCIRTPSSALNRKHLLAYEKMPGPQDTWALEKGALSPSCNGYAYGEGDSRGLSYRSPHH